ncbi:MAG: ribosome assembly factor SBDS [Candidatus Korarchaeota archaeon NZ13-K]|nr:MAG: ribosome assembly factor SBDS [Candidatus Korarchaeota archaeon NZ13-K]
MPEPVIARITRAGKKFEIYVYPEKAYQFREGKSVDIKSVLAVEAVFTDAKKSEIAPTSDLKRFFGTTDVYSVAERILREGEVQLTAEYRRRLQEEKLRWIINYIHKNFVDPQTNLPHPPSRIERAMKEAKVKIDPMKEPEQQVKEVVDQLRKVLPLKTGQVKMVITVPSSAWAKARALLLGQGNILSEKWSEDGDKVTFTVEVPVGAQMLLLERIGEMGGQAKVE